MPLLRELQLRYPKQPLPKVYKRIMSQCVEIIGNGFHYNHIFDGQKFEVEGATLVATYTPGHCNDHVTFLIEVLYTKILRCTDIRINIR